MIRSALLKSVYSALASHQYLALEDFIVAEYTNKESEPCLSIKYRYDSELYFNFHIPATERKINKEDYSSNFWFNCTMSPGREAAVESLLAKEREGVLSQISAWMKRLYEDIVAAPVVRQFTEHSSALKELRDKLEQLPDEPLSKEDVVQFQEGLDRLKTDFSEQLKSATADKEELKQRIDELGRDIEFLKQSLQSMTSRQWGEILVIRLRKWKDKFSLKQLTTGARILQKLLPSNMSAELDGVIDVAEKVADVVNPKN